MSSDWNHCNLFRNENLEGKECKAEVDDSEIYRNLN